MIHDGSKNKIYEETTGNTKNRVVTIAWYAGFAEFAGKSAIFWFLLEKLENNISLL